MPNNITAGLLAHIASGDLAHVKRCLSRAAGISESEKCQLRALIAMKEGRVRLAIDLLESLGGYLKMGAHGLNNLGLCYLTAGLNDKALSVLEIAASRFPGDPDIANNLGQALMASGDVDRSVFEYRRCLRISPSNPTALFNLAVAIGAKSRDEAEHCLEQCILLDSSNYRAFFALAGIYLEKGLYSSACERLDSGIKGLLDHHKIDNKLVIRLGDVTQTLLSHPEVFRSLSEQQDWSARIDSALIDLEDISRCTHVLTNRDRQVVLQMLFLQSNFYWAYHLENDVRWNSSFASSVSRLIGLNRFGLRSRKSGVVRKLLVVSQSWGMHVTRWIYHFLKSIKRELPDIEIVVVSLNQTHPTDIIYLLSDIANIRSHACTPENFLLLVDNLRSEGFDCCFIPDIGMTPASRYLSLVRIAPVQFTHWAHPVTTGSTEIDYFLSSEAMEVEGASENYSERLVTLRHIGIFAEKEVLRSQPEPDFFNSYFPGDRVAFVAPQSIFKFHPRYDQTYLEVLGRCPEASVFFVAGHNEHMTKTFDERLADQSSDLSVRARVLFLPRLTHPQYMGLFFHTVINLDSIGWSGGNTSLIALSAGCPTVTMRGRLMRSNHTAAMLKLMDLEELVADTESDYIQIATRLFFDRDYYAEVRSLIKERSDRLFERLEPLQDFNNFIKGLTSSNCLL